MNDKISRRSFLKSAAGVSAGAVGVLTLGAACGNQSGKEDKGVSPLKASIFYDGDIPLYVQIGDSYFNVESGREANSLLGLVNDELKEGKEGYNHKTLTEVVARINNNKSYLIQPNTPYFGIGSKLPADSVSSLEQRITNYKVQHIIRL
ncbi:MAG: twin-arginine translocation signal domain-containing protein [Nanoarchaeota archaeon]|nr:twin-arginine translocation signal domain-containing protein [Nanoarchaeota archaeon]